MNATSKSKLLEKNLYDLLEVAHAASEKEIKKAYRKKALKCHPDKNPDNPKAAELFHELSLALEILTDTKAKEAYDRTLKAKALAKERTRVLDSKRRKLKEDLERREQVAKESAVAAKKAAANIQVPEEEQLQKEIDRLKKEGSRALQEEQELMRQQILKDQKNKISFIQNAMKPDPVAATDEFKPRFKVKWSSSVAIDSGKLQDIFEKYGELSELIVIKRTALVEFKSQESAEKAFAAESIKSEFQWKFEWVSRPRNINDNKGGSNPPLVVPPPQQKTNFSASSTNGPMSTTGFADFEAMILGQLSAAAAAQKNDSAEKS